MKTNRSRIALPLAALLAMAGSHAVWLPGFDPRRTGKLQPPNYSGAKLNSPGLNRGRPINRSRERERNLRRLARLAA